MELAIFPLNGAVLFPGTSLPLNIFENRYIEMVNYSLARDRYIGMIQTDTNNKLYKIGCVGKIHSFSETNDGRYLISLQGTNCFKVIKELEPNYSFRIIEADLISTNDEIYELKQENEELKANLGGMTLTELVDLQNKSNELEIRYIEKLQQIDYKLWDAADIVIWIINDILYS